MKYVKLRYLGLVTNVCGGQVVYGIQYIHKELGILHGSISAENVLVNKSGSVKLGRVPANSASEID